MSCVAAELTLGGHPVGALGAFIVPLALESPSHVSDNGPAL